jgi:hypothetical protein
LFTTQDNIEDADAGSPTLLNSHISLSLLAAIHRSYLVSTSADIYFNPIRRLPISRRPWFVASQNSSKSYIQTQNFEHGMHPILSAARQKPSPSKSSASAK